MSKIKPSMVSAARACLAASAFLLVPATLVGGQVEIEPNAAKVLEKSMSYVGSLQQFGLEVQNSLEVVLVGGQKIQFDSMVGVTVKRPNKLHAVRLGELIDQEFFYDGKTLTLHDVDAGLYASIEAPDTLEGMLDFARDSLDIVAPAGDFIYSNAFDILMQDTESGFIIGQSFIEGVWCDHIAFSKPGTDFQVWVQQGDQPLPRKLVITSRDVLNAPQFTVQIKEWNLSPGVPDEKFQFIQPDEAASIEFILLDADGN